jgi:hypothetical protein
LDFSGGYQMIFAPAKVNIAWLLWLMIPIVILIVGDLLDAQWGLISLLGKRPVALRWAVY